ncbi:MAG: VCBS repeat-containing protein [Verrucomicrobia bacterium]|nr:VCBS repeat-containing protein [Verrucomicrobiota bacterium]
MKARYLLAACLATGLSAGLQAQDFDESNPNFVRQSAVVLANTDVIGPRTQPERFPTGQSGPSPVENGISYEEFRTLVSQAFAQGLGGVVDFEAVLPVGLHFDFDRTGVRAFIQGELRRNPLQPGELLQTRINQERRRAMAEGIVDTSRIGPVFARGDRSIDDAEDNPFTSEIIYNQIEIRYGLSNENTLVLTRGSQHRVEGVLANRQFPGAEALNTINDNYFFNIGSPTYSGGQLSRSSGTQLLNGGMIDFEIDARDNVVALGFIANNANNFQYWQGFGAPNNPNNVIVTARFSDGTSSVFRGTSDQSSGTNDNFFGILAPEGTSITRVWLRVVGRNFRTFVFIDDLGIVTGPTTPFIAGSREVRGGAGQDFVYSLNVSKSPTAIAVSGLPAGLSYDPFRRIISGTLPATPGSAQLQVTMTNDVGTSVETIDLIWTDVDDASFLPVISGIDRSLNYTIRLNLAGAPAIITNFDDFSEEVLDELPGDVRILNFFTRVFPLDAAGNPLPGQQVTLESLGLAVSAGELVGTPQLDSQAGRYLLEVYVNNSVGGSFASFELNISPSVLGANFDDGALADIALVQANQLRALLASGDGNFAPIRDILALSASSEVFVTDVDADGKTDILVYDPVGRSVDLYLVGSNLQLRNLNLIRNISGDWSIETVADIDGDGIPDILWRDNRNNAYVLWKLGTFNDEAGNLSVEIAWSGFLYSDGVPREFVMAADLRGNGNRELLFRRAKGSGLLYEIMTVDTLPATGRAGIIADSILLTEQGWEPVTAADLLGEGANALIWRNSQTGEVIYWNMATGSVPSEYLHTTATVGSPLGVTNMNWQIRAGVAPKNPAQPLANSPFRSGDFVDAGTVIGNVAQRFNVNFRFESPRTRDEDPEILLWGLRYLLNEGDSVSNGTEVAELVVERVDGSSVLNETIRADRRWHHPSLCPRIYSR